jgi:heterodisulfide reductase subunit A
MNTSKPNVVVLGSGVAGLSATLALGAYDVSVHLVEKEDRLGGHALKWACMATDTCQYCGACLGAELLQQVQDTSHTTIHLNSIPERINIQEAGYSVALKGVADETIHADAVLIATGMTPFDPGGVDDLGYGTFHQVKTTADINAILQEDRLATILPDTPAPSIAYIQCVGSRDRQSDRDYCSQVCCKTAVRQVNKILDQKPEADITIFHIDLQVIGKVFRSQAASALKRVKLHQGVPGRIWNDRQEGKVSVIQEDNATGARTAHHFDLIVLAVGMVPSPEMSRIADQLDSDLDRWGFASGSSNLATGIYAAGASRGPMDILSAKAQGAATAHRMAKDLGWEQSDEKKLSVAVIGDGPDGAVAANALTEDGYGVTVLDHGPAEKPDSGGSTWFSNIQLNSVTGTVGQYCLSFSSGSTEHQLDAAAIVVAGGVHAEASMESGDHDDQVVSLSRFIETVDTNQMDSTQRVVFWLDRNGPEWKAYSRQCLKMATSWASQGKDAAIIMDKMLVHGIEGQQLYDQARHKGVRFLRIRNADQVNIQHQKNSVLLEIPDTSLTDVTLILEADVLVIPEGVQPPAWSERVAHRLRQSLDEEGVLQSANVRHRPVGSPRKGVFFLGSCHDEIDPLDFQDEIKTLRASLAQLFVNGPLDPPAVIDEGKCAKCLTCYRACAHSAVMITEGYQPMIVAEACVGCGICVSSCPATAISHDPAGSIPKFDLSEGDTVVFACQRSGLLAAKAASLDKPNTHIIPVRCAGQIDEQTLLQPLLDGASAVRIAACHDGNCRSMTGSRTADARANKLTAQIGLQPGELSLHTIAANEPARMANIVGADVISKEASND